MTITDPMERIIAEALEQAGVKFVMNDANDAQLDFYLPDYDLYIEVKQFHSERIAGQMSRAKNVIVAQGGVAVATLAALLRQIDSLKIERF